MCLIVLTPNEIPCDIGYKVFFKKGNRYYGEYQARTVGRKIGETYKARKIVIGGERYTSGFHVFHTVEDAEFWQMFRPGNTIVKVKTDGKKITGIQSDGVAYRECTVAEYITLIEEVK